MMKIYGDKRSGNCYKIQLTCALLDLDYEWIDVDILAGEAGTDEFRKMNPNGKIPLLALDDRYLSESNAIINFLAHGSPLLPDEPFLLAKVQQWQFFEQYSHEPYIAVARFIEKYLGLPDDRKAEYLSRQNGGYRALSIMEQQLSDTAFITGASFTTADIALYAYTHVAHEGGFSLDRFPAIQQWLTRVTEQPGYRAMG